MSIWTTLHISTLNPQALPETFIIEKAVKIMKSWYLEKFENDYEIRDDDIIFHIYGVVSPIERKDAFNKNDAFIYQMNENICPKCKVDLTFELYKLNDQLIGPFYRQDEKSVNQYQLPIQESQELLFGCKCGKQNPNEVGQELLFGRFEIIDLLYTSRDEDYSFLMRDLELIFKEPLIYKLQVNN